MPRANGPQRRDAPPSGVSASRSLELVLDHDFAAPRERQDRSERRTIDTMIGPDLVQWLQRLATGEDEA